MLSTFPTVVEAGAAMKARRYSQRGDWPAYTQGAAAKARIVIAMIGVSNFITNFFPG